MMETNSPPYVDIDTAQDKGLADAVGVELLYVSELDHSNRVDDARPPDVERDADAAVHAAELIRALPPMRPLNEPRGGGLDGAGHADRCNPPCTGAALSSALLPSGIESRWRRSPYAAKWWRAFSLSKLASTGRAVETALTGQILRDH